MFNLGITSKKKEGRNRDYLVKKILKEYPQITRTAIQINKAMPYKFPNNYIEWENLSRLAASQLVAYNDPILMRKCASENDRAGYFNIHTYCLWAVQQAPIYCISREVLEAITNTEVRNDIIKNLNIPLPTMMLLFPDGIIRTSERATVDHMIVHTSDLECPENSRGEGFGYVVPHKSHVPEVIMNCATIDKNSTAWLAAFTMDDCKALDSNNLGPLNLDQKDSEFIRLTRKIALMTYIILQSNPEMIGEVSDSEIPHSKGFGGHSRQQQSFIKPRIIKLPTDREKRGTPSISTHVSKRTHWRRAHYRTITAKDGQSRLVYIRPSIVNPQH